MTGRENLAEGQALAWRESLEEVWDALDHLDTDDASHDPDDCATCAEIREAYGEADSDTVRERLDEMPLEIVWELGEPFAVVLGTGGPHTEVTGGGRWSGSGYTLECYWGGDRATLRGEAINRTGDYFRELVSQ